MSLTKVLLLTFGTVWLISGCGIVPTWVSIAHTGVDFLSYKSTGKTTGEHALSGVTKKDCRFTRILRNKKVCMTPEEEVDHIVSLNCEGWIKWDFLGVPYCSEEK